MGNLSLCLFGAFSAMLDGQTMKSFDSNKVRALLVYLVVEANHPHRRDSLATLLWPESPQRSARTNLRNALANLRKVLRDDDHDQPFILITRDTLQFNRKSNAHIDVTAFNALVNIENPTLQQLENAVDIYRGSFLQGFSLKDCLVFDDWTLIIRERLHRTALAALRDLSAHYAQQGQYNKACQFSRKQVEMEPWREQAHRDLMRLLAVSGQRSEALMQYETCRQVLDAELSVSPSQETKLLHEQIREGTLEITGTPVTVSQSTPSSPRHNLPVQLTPFVGRKEELAAIGKRMEKPACRLLTLVGPGGSGKTRLAIEVGSRLVDNFEHGVFLVSLASLKSVDSLISTLAGALNFTFFAGVNPKQQILNYLRQKNLLLIFDNFEHLLSPSDTLQKDTDHQEFATTLVIEILKCAPDIKIMVTSRVRLNMQGEILFPVLGMLYPHTMQEAIDGIATPRILNFAQYSAVELFVLSARRVSSNWEFTISNQAYVASICRLVSGLPLGILLASAWVNTLTAAEIANQIGESYDFLETEMRDIPERQRSLRSVFNHSWNLLSPREREILQSFSVFSGQFSLIAAKAITRATLCDLRSLVDKSLLHMNVNGYFELHELVRQYAVEKRSEFADAGESVSDRHSAYYTTALAQWSEQMKRQNERSVYEEIDSEYNNILAAWEWTINNNQIKRIPKSYMALINYMAVTGRIRACEMLLRRTVDTIEALVGGYNTEGLSMENAESFRILAVLLARHVWIGLNTSGYSERVKQHAQRSRNLINSFEKMNMDVRMEKAAVFYSTAELYESTRLEEETMTVALYRELDEPYWTIWSLWKLGWSYWRLSNYTEAQHLWQQALNLSRKLGSVSLTATLLSALGSSAWESGDYVTASQIWTECLERNQQPLVGVLGRVHAMQDIVFIYLLYGHLIDAENYAKMCVQLSREYGNISYIWVGLRRLGLVLMASGRYIEADASLHESMDITTNVDDPYEIGTASIRFAQARLHLGRYSDTSNLATECLKSARKLGSQRNISLTLVLLGRLALVNGKHQESANLLQQGIDILEGMGPRRELGPAYADLCLSSMRLGNTTEAKQHLKTALEYATKTGDFVAHVYVLPIVALYFANQDQIDKVEELYSLAVSYPMVANSRWFADIIGNTFRTTSPHSIVENLDATHAETHISELQSTVNHLLQEVASPPA